MNGLARTITDIVRTVLVWVVSIIVTLTLGAEKENYVWELTKTGAIFVQLFGFILIIVGNLIYNRFISLPFQ